MFRPGLYAILDLELVALTQAPAVAEALLAGGAVVLQLRAKAAPVAEVRPLAAALRGIAAVRGVPFVINDDLALAAAVGADGVHLGQDDASPETARRVLGPGRLIGLSTHDLEQVRRAQAEPVDYLGFGPVYPTATKTNPDPVVGPYLLGEACRASGLPIVAIGGIDRQRIGEVARRGAHAAAVIGAILRAEDPREAVEAHAHAFAVATPLG